MTDRQFVRLHYIHPNCSHIWVVRHPASAKCWPQQHQSKFCVGNRDHTMPRCTPKSSPPLRIPDAKDGIENVCQLRAVLVRRDMCAIATATRRHAVRRRWECPGINLFNNMCGMYSCAVGLSGVQQWWHRRSFVNGHKHLCRRDPLRLRKDSAAVREFQILLKDISALRAFV